jgi:hypothetical protein
MTDEMIIALGTSHMDGITSDEPAGKSAAARAAETIQSASHRVSNAIETGREPGMPLDILSRLVREAPLHSLAIAFLLGVAISRRR